MATLIDNRHHVEINAVKYRLAEDAEGDHYNLGGEPLRPPNAVMVQGEGKQDQFQARPDMLLWNITDWSGGEGQIVFNAQDANRHAVLYNVDPFIRPGTLQPGYDFQQLTDSGATPLNKHLALTKMSDSLIGLDQDTAAKYYIWDNVNEYWGAEQTMTSVVPTGISLGSTVCADETYVYFHEYNTNNVHRLIAGTTVNEVLSTSVTGTVLGQHAMEELGDYLYWVDFNTAEVVEIPKSGTPPVAGVQVWTGDPAIDAAYTGKMAKGANRMYILFTTKTDDTSIIEIVPTSAAGPGYGREIARWNGIRGTSLWWHSGTLFVGAMDSRYAENKRVLMYLIPGGDYGTLGRVRPPEEEDYDGLPWGSEQADLLLSPFLTYGADATRVWVIDTVSGGYAQLAEIDGTELSRHLVFHRGEMFFSNPRTGAGGYTYRIYKDQYVQADVSYAITPWHNMGLSDEKILSSLVLSCEALPADWDIIISYAVDGSSSYTTAGTYTTDSGTGTKYAVSTDSSTKKFRTLRVKIAFDYTGAGSPTTKPVVHGVEVRAQVAKPVRVWNLLLDLSDDHGNASQSHVGSRKFTNITTAGQSGDVVDFKDGYANRLTGSYTQHDVVVDGYRMILDRAGEGVALVSLREVV